MKATVLILIIHAFDKKWHEITSSIFRLYFLNYLICEGKEIQLAHYEHQNVVFKGPKLR